MMWQVDLLVHPGRGRLESIDTSVVIDGDESG